MELALKVTELQIFCLPKGCILYLDIKDDANTKIKLVNKDSKVVVEVDSQPCKIIVVTV